MIYFDNAATSRLKPTEVYDAYNYYIHEIGVSPGRGSYRLGIQASRMLYQARKTVANFFGVSETSHVIFTKNSTEAINLFLNGWLSKNDHVLISPYEHNAVLRPLHALSEEKRIQYSLIPNDDLYSDVSNLNNLIQPNTRLVVLTLASNLTGQIVFSHSIAEFFHNKGICVFVDASQGAGKKLINMSSDFIDVLAFTGHKDLFGLPGVGGLCSQTNLNMKPLIQGGTGIHGEYYVNPNMYPEAFEAGTLNMPAIWALKAGIEYINLHSSEIYDQETNLMNKLISGLSSMSRIKIYNVNYKRVPTFCFNINGMKSNELVEKLDKKDICLRGGIHCAILAHKTINTVETGAVRVSINHFNTINEVNSFLSIISGMEC